MDSRKQTYMLVGIAAASVAATVTAYVLIARQRQVTVKVDSVQDLLDRCHAQVRSIEGRLGELTAA